MVSRQRLWQIEQKKKGLCLYCAEKAVQYSLCKRHIEYNKAHQKESKRKKNKFYEHQKAKKKKKAAVKLISTQIKKLEARLKKLRLKKRGLKIKDYV